MGRAGSKQASRQLFLPYCEYSLTRSTCSSGLAWTVASLSASLVARLQEKAKMRRAKASLGLLGLPHRRDGLCRSGYGKVTPPHPSLCCCICKAAEQTSMGLSCRGCQASILKIMFVSQPSQHLWHECLLPSRNAAGRHATV